MRVAAALLLALAPAVTHAAEVTRARYLMGTVCEITVAKSSSAETQIDAAFAEAARIEAMISTWRDDSELSRLNHGEIANVSPELRMLLSDALDWSRRTGGSFNPLMRPLIDAWGTRGSGAIPGDQVRIAAMRRTQLENASIDNDSIQLTNGAQFEEGAFGKGYALDRMLAVLRERDASEALINFGGQLAGYGATRTVTIADPRHRDQPLASLAMNGGSLSTSSGSEKWFERNGRRYSHIIDPATGEPLPPRGSVSVLHESALTADILSTALYVMGRDKGVEWAREHGVVAVFISEAGEITTSRAVEGLAAIKESAR